MQVFSEICGPSVNGLSIARTRQGELFKCENGEWKAFDFNEEYQGYYPYCRFSKIGYLADQFYLAGVDQNENPRLFVSLMGSVWEERNINAYHPLDGWQKPSGCIVEMLCDETTHQVFLITDQGNLLVLPDCPKCVRILPIRPGAIGGRLADSCIQVLYQDQTVQDVSIRAALQLRASMSYMRNRLKAGALLIDVRSEELRSKFPIEESIWIPVEDIGDWLQAQCSEQEMYFICMFGAQADRAVSCARRMGFRRAYSVGGIKELTHID